jgi:Tol biopolymer transport system component
MNIRTLVLALAVPALVALPAAPVQGSGSAESASRAVGTIAFVSDRDGGNDHLFTVPAGGGPARQLTEGDSTNRAPQWSPDGRLLVFNSRRAPHVDRPQLYTLNVASERLRRITRGGTEDARASFAADGSRIFFQRGTFTRGFAIMQTRIRGGAVRQLTPRQFDGRPIINAAADAHPRNDTVVFQTNRDADSTFPFTLATLKPGDACAPDQCARPRVAAIPTRLDDSIDGPRWSPDGSRLAFAAGGDLFVLRPTSGALERVTTGDAFDLSPDWSPDGRSLVFQSDRRVRSGGIHVVRLSDGAVRFVAEGRTPVWTG